jgi:hypothetical protein
MSASEIEKQKETLNMSKMKQPTIVSQNFRNQGGQNFRNRQMTHDRHFRLNFADPQEHYLKTKRSDGFQCTSPVSEF